jgi:hypothetical protein
MRKLKLAVTKTLPGNESEMKEDIQEFDSLES